MGKWLWISIGIIIIFIIFVWLAQKAGQDDDSITGSAINFIKNCFGCKRIFK